MVKDIDEFERCWACDKLVGKGDYKYFSRLEYHHIFEDKEIPLCMGCHDLVDRFSLNTPSVFAKYLKVIGELESMPRGKYPMIKLLFLKIIKVTKE